MRALTLCTLLASGCCLPSAEPPPPPPNVVGVGDRIVYPDAYEFVVLEVTDHGEQLPSPKGWSNDPNPEERYLTVRFSEKNLSDETSMHVVVPRLTDDAGESYGGLGLAAQAYTPPGTLSYPWHEIEPGEELEFATIYVVDPAATGLKIERWDTMDEDAGPEGNTPPSRPLLPETHIALGL